MKAKNKMISGHLKEFRFINRFGMLYLKCLEKEIAINKMTISSMQVIESKEYPSAIRMLGKGCLLSKLFGGLGMLIGVSTSKKKLIYTIKLTFSDLNYGLAEIDEKVYKMLLVILFDV